MKLSYGISNSVSSQKASNERRVKARYQNDDAQAAVIYLLVVGLVAFLAVFIWMSPVMDGFSSFHANATNSSNPHALPLSQDRQDAIFVTQIIYQDSPIIFFILLIIASVVATLKWRTSNV